MPRQPDDSTNAPERSDETSVPGPPLPEESFPSPEDNGLAEIDDVCDAFEDAWKNGDVPPKLEDYLQDVPEPNRHLLLKELLRTELWWRHHRGEQAQAVDYEQRFPQYLPLLEELLRQPLDGSQSPRSASLSRTGILPRGLTTTYITSRKIGDSAQGRYRIQRVLGEGAFGRVYLAFDEELRRQVAVKVPTAERFRRSEDMEMYLSEARTVAGLDHAHIVPVYDMGRTDDGSIYVVSRFVDGRTLEQSLADGIPEPAAAAALTATLAEALQTAHDRRTTAGRGDGTG